jgi:hypothetical protein
MKSKKMIRAGRVARTGELSDEFSSEQYEGREHWKKCTYVVG